MAVFLFAVALVSPPAWAADGWDPSVEAAFARVRSRLLRPPSGFARNVLSASLSGQPVRPGELHPFLEAAGPLVHKLDIHAYPDRFSGAHTTNDRDLQMIVDAVFSRLFAGPMGRSLCQEAGGSAERLQAYFGLSLETAQSWERPCSVSAERATRIREREAGQPIWRPLRRSHSVIVAAPGLSPAVDGWSVEGNPIAEAVIPATDITRSRGGASAQGDSAVAFFRADRLSLNGLAYRMLHEAAIFFDDKAFLSSRRWTDEQSTRSPRLEDHPCSLASALAHPSVALALASIRAMKLEILWLREMGLPEPRSSAASGHRARDLACPHQLTAVAASLERGTPGAHLDRRFYDGDLGRALEIEGGRGLCAVEHRDTLANPRDALAPISRSVAIERLSAAHVLLSDGRSVSACEFAVEPEIGLRGPTFIRRGPRPGFGGGW